MTQTAIMTPLDKMLRSFPDARLKLNGFYNHPDNPRFDFWVRDDGSIGIHPLTGREAKDVLAMGRPPLTFADLYPRDHEWRPAARPERQLDLVALADYLKLPVSYLYSLGWRDGFIYRNTRGHRTVCVKLGGYCYPDGTPSDKIRVRLSIDGKFRFKWSWDTPAEPLPCGLHRIHEAILAGYIFFVEGESDCATMWFHGKPCIGIPGADAQKLLDVGLLAGVPRVYIIEEPDQAQKNSDQGGGFYANLRRHLREGGYTGEIFSIRWKRATGSKDPSNLHKVCVRDCQGVRGDEQATYAQVTALYTAALHKAMSRAIPEGNETLAAQDEPLPPDEPPPAPVVESDRLQWIAELCAVSADKLSPAHKIVLLVILLHSPIWNSTSEYWWQVDAAALAPLAGMSQKQFLKHLSYLTDSASLFSKRHRKIWYTAPDAPRGKKVRTELYITPVEGTWRAYPSTIAVAPGELRQHGGKRTPAPQCAYCGSVHLEKYTAYYCLDCHQTTYLQEEEEATPSATAPVEVETTLALPAPRQDAATIENEQVEQAQANDTGILPKTGEGYSQKPNLGTLSPLFIQGANLGKSPAREQEYSQKDKLGFWEYQDIAAESGIPLSEPCRACGCPLAYELAGEPMCYRCYPRSQQRGGLLSDAQYERLAAIPRHVEWQSASPRHPRSERKER